MTILAGPVLVLAASSIGSYLLGEGMWATLDTLAKRSEATYNKTMESLQRDFKTYATQVLSKEPSLIDSENRTWAERTNIAPKKIKIVPKCPHDSHPDDQYFDFSTNIACHKNEEKCIEQRKKIKETKDSFLSIRARLIQIPGREAVWFAVALITGLAVAAFSTFLIMPIGTALTVKVWIIIGVGFCGSLAAACTTISRLKYSCDLKYYSPENTTRIHERSLQARSRWWTLCQWPKIRCNQNV